MEEHYISAAALASAAGMAEEALLAAEPLLMRLLSFDLVMHTPFRPLEGLLPVHSPASRLDTGRRTHQALPGTVAHATPTAGGRQLRHARLAMACTREA